MAIRETHSPQINLNLNLNRTPDSQQLFVNVDRYSKFSLWMTNQLFALEQKRLPNQVTPNQVTPKQVSTKKVSTATRFAPLKPADDFEATDFSFVAWL